MCVCVCVSVFALFFCLRVAVAERLLVVGLVGPLVAARVWRRHFPGCLRAPVRIRKQIKCSFFNLLST